MVRRGRGWTYKSEINKQIIQMFDNTDRRKAAVKVERREFPKSKDMLEHAWWFVGRIERLERTNLAFVTSTSISCFRILLRTVYFHYSIERASRR